MAQDVHSTRDVMKNQDYGIAPSLRFGIGTPTEVTLNALLTHNHDMPDYGLPPRQRRAGGRSTGRTSTARPTTGRSRTWSTSTRRSRHTFTPTIKLRNQTQYSHYTIGARESGPNNVGTVTNGVYTAFPATNLGNATPLPLDVLFVGLGSHDRDITDTSLYNQTDLITEFTTGPIAHLLIAGLELGQDTNNTQNYSRNIPGNPNNYFRAFSLVNPAYEPAGGIPDGHRQPRASERHRRRAVHQRHDVVRATTGRSSPACATTATTRASPTRSTCPPSASQSIGYTSVRAGVIYQPTDTQSYYVSYGTSFNPSLETLALTNGQQSLDPETSRQYELGAKWDLLDGDLSVTSAIFDIEKDNMRSQISAGRLRADRQHPRARASRPASPAGSRATGRCSAATRTSTPRSSRPPCSTARRARCRRTRRRTARRCGPRTTSRATWQAGTGVTYMSDRYASNNNAVKVPGLLPLGRDGRLRSSRTTASSSTCST